MLLPLIGVLISFAVLFSGRLTAQTYSKSILVTLGGETCNATIPFVTLTDKSVAGDPIILNCNASNILGNALSDAFIEYDANTNYIYLAKRAASSTSVWRYDIGLGSPSFACPVLSTTPTYTYNFSIDNFSIDQAGDLYSIGNYNASAATASLNRLNVATGANIVAQTLQFPLGNSPTSLGSGDLTFVTNGKLYAVYGATTGSKLYEISNYGSTTGNAVATFLVNIPQAVYGIAYINDRLQLSGNSGSSCYFYTYDVASATLSAPSIFPNGRSAIDNTSIYTSIGSSKRLLKNTTVNSNTSDIEYEIYLRNTGNVELKQVQLTDDLGAVFGASNISNVTTSIVNNTANLTLNTSYNGTTNINLLNTGQNIKNQLAVNSVTIKVSLRVTNLNVGQTYNNQATASGIVGTSSAKVSVSDLSNNGPNSSIFPLGTDEKTPFSYDSDFDGIGDIEDLDDDNDGILDTVECDITQRIANGNFSGTSTGNVNTVPSFVVDGSTNNSAPWTSGVGKINYSTDNGLTFLRDGSTVTQLSQNLTGVRNGSVLNLNDLFWRRTTDDTASGGFSFTISYAGTIYATINSNSAATPVITAQNGASVNLSVLPAVAAASGVSGKVNLAIVFPAIPASGLLVYTFTAGSNGTQVRDLGMKSISLITSCLNSDTDSIPNNLDIDSDNDGCPDAIEGSENVTNDQVHSLALPTTDPNYLYRGQIKVIFNGTTVSTPPNIISTSPNGNGVPQLLNNAGNNLNSTTNPTNLAGIADNTGMPAVAGVGQGIGDSQNASVNSCVCYIDPYIGGVTAPTKHGITLLKRGGSAATDWPAIRTGAFTVLESNNKGFVITRMNTFQIGKIVSPQDGMMVFDTDQKCLKIYTTDTAAPANNSWRCYDKPACP